MSEKTLAEKVNSLFVIGDESHVPGHVWWVLSLSDYRLFGSTDEGAVERKRDELIAEIVARLS